jgi:outer membrane scaffolding protein for murein synthesis (MipA/OmpV family)
MATLRPSWSDGKPSESLVSIVRGDILSARSTQCSTEVVGRKSYGKYRLLACLAGFLLVVASPTISRAEKLPLWEAGLGFAGLSLPDYRGSDQQRFYVLPLPYLVYRGDFLRLDSNGITGLLFHSERVRLNISADAAVPVNSSEDTARRGMPDLKPVVQIGPSIEISLYRDTNSERVVQFWVPVRAAIATDLSRWNDIGFVVNPQLTFDFNNTGPGKGWNFGLAVGPLFATEPYHEYYYGVAPRYAVPGSRPAYDARGGYSGSMLILTVTKRLGHFWFGAFARYDELSGAVFANSPLMRTDQSVMTGFGLAWVFAESKSLVSPSP